MTLSVKTSLILEVHKAVFFAERFTGSVSCMEYDQPVHSCTLLHNLSPILSKVPNFTSILSEITSLIPLT